MRIAHVITTIERGGAENALLTLVEEQAKRYDSVTIFPLKGELQLMESLLRVGALVDTSFLNKPVFVQLIKAFTSRPKVDLIHAHLPRAELLVFFARMRPYVISRHNSERFFPGAPNILSSFISRLVTASSSGVISISKAVYRFLKANHEIAKRIDSSIIHYGYNKTSYQTFMKRPSNKSESSNFVTISRLAPQKNLSFMLKIIEELAVLNIDVTLTIVGTGPLLGHLSSEVREKRLNNRVKFVGKIDYVVDFIRSFDYFILTSHYEGFGLALLEAMDAGLVIFAPRNSSIPEVLGENHPGLFADGDANDFLKVFLGLYSDAKAKSNIRKIQSKQLEYFTCDRYYAEIDLAYRRALATK